jgi:uncharacterized protein HemX
MKDQQWQQQEQLPTQPRDPLQTGPLEGDASYPAAIEKMSDKWREVQKQERQEVQPRNFIERNSLGLGIGLALLIIALLIVIGGFAFLVWNAR